MQLRRVSRQNDNSRYHRKRLLTNNAELYSGQLVKDEYFTLFEAVGALEVGNESCSTSPMEVEAG